jgi:hypothetical protein
LAALVVAPPLLDPSSVGLDVPFLLRVVWAIGVLLLLAMIAFSAAGYLGWRATAAPPVSPAPEHVRRVGEPFNRHTHVCACGTVILCPASACAYADDYQCDTCHRWRHDAAMTAKGF